MSNAAALVYLALTRYTKFCLRCEKDITCARKRHPDTEIGLEKTDLAFTAKSGMPPGAGELQAKQIACQIWLK